MIISNKNMKDMQFLLAILIFSVVSYLVLKVSEGLCTKTTTCNQCNNCKNKGNHWGWPTHI
jgi:hypothetical protein